MASRLCTHRYSLLTLLAFPYAGSSRRVRRLGVLGPVRGGGGDELTCVCSLSSRLGTRSERTPLCKRRGALFLSWCRSTKTSGFRRNMENVALLRRASRLVEQQATGGVRAIRCDGRKAKKCLRRHAKARSGKGPP